MTDAATKVEISFFKPTGYSDMWVVETENRGLAIIEVMAKYGDETKYINYIESKLCDPKQYPYLDLIEKKDMTSNIFGIRMFKNFVPVDNWLEQVREKLTPEEYEEFDRLMAEASEKTQLDHIELSDNKIRFGAS